MKDTHRSVVFGAGAIGNAIAAQLVAAGHRVRAATSSGRGARTTLNGAAALWETPQPTTSPSLALSVGFASRLSPSAAPQGAAATPSPSEVATVSQRMSVSPGTKT